MTKSSSAIFHLLHTVKSSVKILSIFVAILENVNFKWIPDKIGRLFSNFVVLLEYKYELFYYLLAGGTRIGYWNCGQVIGPMPFPKAWNFSAKVAMNISSSGLKGKIFFSILALLKMLLKFKLSVFSRYCWRLCMVQKGNNFRHYVSRHLWFMN